jgi:hypothetical protein
MLELSGVRVYLLAESGSVLRGERDALEVVGETVGVVCEWIAIPVGRFAAECFALKTRVLGEMAQKFVNYGLRVAVVGDVSAQAAASDAFRDFVRETNRGRQLWFVASLAELGERFAVRAGERS